MRFLRLLPLPVLAAGVLAPALSAGANPPETPPAAGPANAGAPAPTCRDLTDKEKGAFATTLRAYLDMDTKPALSRLELLRHLKSLKDAGCDPLRNVEIVSSLLYSARPFDPPFDRKSVQKGEDFNVDAVTGVMSIDASIGRFSFQLPSKYPKDAKALNAGAPFPMIVTLHDLVDFQEREVKKYPGAEVIKRRFPRATNKGIHEDFILFAPVATRAKFSADGAIDADKVPLNLMWRRYQVDFDRIVIDGGSDALLFAAAHTIYYAGVIVRGDAADVAPDLVKNFAHLPVYVVGTDASAAKKSLLAGGMPKENVRVGDEAGLHAWVKGLKRQTPKSFEWVVKDRNAQRFAHFVNVNEIDPEVKVPSLKVDVLDTTDDPNTVKVSSKGVRAISLFLNDQILSLDKPVRVVVNGRPLSELRILTGREARAVKLPALLDRNADIMLDARDDLSVRKSRYYGFLFPVITDGIKVPGDADEEEKAAPKNGAPGGGAPAAAPDPQKVAEAQQYFDKAVEAQGEGDVERAKRLLKRAIEIGDTPVKPKAEAKLAELEKSGAAK
jgi:hypothetical protein